jgi:hypothetical protein
MKKAIVVFLFSYLAYGAAASAALTECAKDFGLDVAFCSKAYDSLTSPEARSTYQKGCVAQAKMDKALCQSGTDPVQTCLNNCNAAFDSSEAVCEADYQDDLFACGTNSVCQIIAAGDRAACISAATDTLNTCSASCTGL